MVSSPYEVISFFFQLYASFQPNHRSGVDSVSNRNEHQNMFLESKAQPARKADSLTVICEPIAKTKWELHFRTL
jgi:hypothetical protein